MQNIKCNNIVFRGKEFEGNQNVRRSFYSFRMAYNLYFKMHVA